ncbi:BspA family leucine-rich repeat surface protein [Slackia isoflavoniconvertens]|uniref:BspA family leucine-rich repeat surface protein n=1 Tax=Slackia isoflavoniconvertens TaxID=572010 RepID=UPI002E79BBD5|nr:BspA family leucine-rich repeat surface protein [Slackia isoflavoniconvertens]
MKKVDHLAARAFKGAMAFVLAVGLCPVAPAMAQEGVAANEEGDTAAAAADGAGASTDGADVSTDGAVAGATGDVAGSEADGMQPGGVSGDGDAAAGGVGVGAPAQDAVENDATDSGVSTDAAEAAAVADEEADESNDAARSGGWNEWGGCEWKIESGLLTIRPAGGAAAGMIPELRYDERGPWYDSGYRSTVRALKIEEGVQTGRDCNSLFMGLEWMEEADVANLEVMAAANMSNMFRDCKSLKSLDLSNWNTSFASNMKCMFDGCRSLASLNLSGWDTSNVRDMSWMFGSCGFSSIDLSGFDTSLVVTMAGMFDGCESLSSIDLSSFDTSSVRSMKRMFAYCRPLSSIDLSNFETSHVTNMNEMFVCTSLASVDLTGLDISSVEGMDCMFQNCDSLVSINLSGQDAQCLTSMRDFAYGCTSLVSVDFSNFESRKLQVVSSAFNGCKALKSIDTRGWIASSIKKMPSTFADCESLASLDLSSWNTSSSDDMINIFGNCKSLESLNISSWDTSRMEGISYTKAFDNCVSLEKISIGPSTKLVFPTIAGKSYTGFWVSLETGKAYKPNLVPLLAGTYVAQKKMTPDLFSIDSSVETYTGSPIEKKVSSDKLVEGVDYSVRYEDNIDVGIAAVIVEGRGFYTGGQISDSFLIKPALIAALLGQKLSDIKLPEGFSWQEPSTLMGELGEHEFPATFTPGDAANYEVVRDVPVKVRVFRAVDASMFSVDAAGLVYDGSAHEPAVSSAVVPEGSYSVEYRDNVNAGEATAVVSGSGFYSGSCELKFAIAKATPECDSPAPVEAAYGQTLSDVALPKGFSWQDGDIPVDWYGSKTQYATYVPEDKNNYNSVSDVPVEVFVLRNEIDVPAVESLTYNGETQVPNLGSLVDGVTVVSNNGGKDAGTYQVTFALENPECDRWSDGTTEDKTVEYSILPRDLNEADVGVEDAVLADGVATPAVNVVSNGQSLVKGVDYDLSFESNDHVGTGVAVVSGTGNYTGEVRLEFRIGIASISDGSPQIYGTDFAYKGSPVTPRVYLAMKNSGVSLREGVDYSVDYSDNDAIGMGKAVLRGIGDYIGTVETTFSIVDRIDLSAEGATTVSVDSIAFYTGSPVEPEVRVRYKQTSLTNGVDYSLRYENNVAEGVATVIVTGKGDYTGEARASFRITNASAYSLSSAGSVYLSGERFLYGGDSFLLAGSKVEPSVSVSLEIGNSRKQLIEGVDYAVSYSSNSSVGTGYVTVKGINGISGSITKSFRIVNSLDVSMLGLGLYDFESDEYLAPAKPKILPSDNFVENVDYRLSYENCDKVGRGKVTVHGMGRYTGTASVEVNIVDKLKRSSLSDCTVDAIPSQVYTGEPIVPNVIVRDGNGRALDSGLEYAVRASDNVNVGTAKVLAHMGAGFVGYSGYLESSFSIEPADINSVEVAGIEDKEYSGKPVTQDALTLTYNGKSLVEGEDYSVEYSDNTKVGSAALKITGEGNFAGERTINFQVKPKTMQYDFVLKEGVASDPSFWNDTMGSTTYRIDLPQGGIVYLGTTLMGVGSVVCSLSDSNGEVLYTWSPKSGETYGAFALAPGSYYFTLLGSTQYGYGTVGARYDVVKFGDNARFQYEMEPNSPSKEQTIPEVATKIELGGVVAGSFCDPLSSLDLDYYEFTLPEYGPVSMDIVTNKSLMFALVNENGVVIADSITGQSIFEETPNSDETTTMHFGILEPGTYYVCCTARYSSSNGASYFLRVHEDLTAARVDFESTTFEYTGKALEPHPTVTRYGSELKEGSDYYVTYDNNVAPGKARATIVGMGRFGGAGAYVGFDIVRSAGNCIALPGHWATGSGGWWYPYDNGGYPANEWCIIDGSYYHFDGSGYMQTGWLNLGGTWYYLSGSGIMQTGWQKIGGSWYWFDDSGAMATGWRVVDGSYYYFDGSGVMQTGWLSTGGAWYYLSGSGAMATGWQTIGGERYHFDGSGAMASGWTVVDGSYYYFDGSGAMQANKWIDGSYVDSDGRWVQNA